MYTYNMHGLLEQVRMCKARHVTHCVAVAAFKVHLWIMILELQYTPLISQLWYSTIIEYFLVYSFVYNG